MAVRWLTDDEKDAIAANPRLRKRARHLLRSGAARSECEALSIARYGAGYAERARVPARGGGNARRRDARRSA